ncbi:MAG: polyprenol monophosphomannose synthase [Acidobacteriota bacterium]|nr:polyprenol monophosphomannose synthase [Acidobacteriota bacterium]
MNVTRARVAAPAAGGPVRAAGTGVLVVVPTFNERDNLPGLTQALLDLDAVRLLVVDDRSPDGTGALADDLAGQHPGRIEVMHRSGPRGLGRSYADGLARALETGAPLIAQMDADLSHAPGHLPAMVAATAHADLVVGSRYCAGGAIENWAPRRRLLSACANRYIRAVTGLRTQDCTSGYRCWTREALARIPLDRIESDGYSFLVEMLHEAVREGLRVAEVPIVFVERRLGESKLSTQVLLESALMPWRLRFRPRPTPAADRTVGVTPS